jgi:hypothetical protein
LLWLMRIPGARERCFRLLGFLERKQKGKLIVLRSSRTGCTRSKVVL